MGGSWSRNVADDSWRGRGIAIMIHDTCIYNIFMVKEISMTNAV